MKIKAAKVLAPDDEEVLSGKYGAVAGQALVTLEVDGADAFVVWDANDERLADAPKGRAKKAKSAAEPEVEADTAEE